MKAFLALTICVLGIACSRSGADVEHPLAAEDEVRLSGYECPKGRGTLQRVQLEELLRHGEKYHDRTVVVTGYYSHSFEHAAIYATQQLDPFQRRFGDGVWVDGLSPFVDGNGQNILVSGVFSTQERGHGGQWAGSICATYVAVRSIGAA
jgi:autonomous glycyl radical cofactor GrcA